MKKLFSILLIALLLTTSMFTRVFAEGEETTETNDEEVTVNRIEDIDPSTLDIPKLGEVTEEESKPEPVYADDEIVRVSIKLEKPATLDIYSAKDVVDNVEAMEYREQLQVEQDIIASDIESETNKELDVQWNLTLAANVISANVEYGDIEQIKNVSGVEDVFVETRYEVQEDVNTALTTEYMTGATMAWAQGYTGAGSRVAVIDTGVNDKHVSFDPDAFEYSLTKDGKSLSDYDLLTLNELTSVLDQLNQNNVDTKHNIYSAQDVYKNSKIPFAFNYVDGGYITDHYSDDQGEHGSHVAGTAAANRYVKKNGNFVEAVDVAGAVGVAPDAQILVMKVFGKNGGAYDSDYFAAIEDAIILKADAFNLSLGSGNPGSSFAGVYQDIMDNLVETHSVMVTSAGNSYNWPAFAERTVKDLYLEDVSEATNGSPGSFNNTLSVAAAQNVGSVGMPMRYNGQSIYYIQSRVAGTTMYDLEGSNEFVYIDAVGEVDDYEAVNSEASLAGKIVIVNRGTNSFFQKGNNAIAYKPSALLVANNQAGTITMGLDGYTGTFPMASITLADAKFIKESAEQHTIGDYTYYTGTIEVTRDVEISHTTDRSDTYITDFSSWGVPGSLVIKPEITAPGGDIWSVDGMTDTDYESMSGTSMAAPHITGMAAVLGQYIRENDLLEKTNGLTTRNLMNSLLMSTATPMKVNGNYLPILEQGAGLSDVNAAINAKSYILMNPGSTLASASALDGKVKAEFGQDNDRTGRYAYSFTINNISNEDIEYTFRTDIFTQDAYEYEGMKYLDTYTVDLFANVSYSYEVHDVDMDGDTDTDDVQALLDYVTGNNSGENLDLAAGEMDGVSGISSYDAQLLLECIQRTGEEKLMVPAGESRQVSVIIQVQDPALLNRENGGYVEGFTYITCVSLSEDGAIQDVEHSIPLLGYYGNWSDPSMTEHVSALDSLYPSDYEAYFNATPSNYMEVRYPTGIRKYVYTGNPYAVEEEFPYDRLAINSSTVITKFANTYIRNVGTAATVVLNENEDLIYSANHQSGIESAFYYVNQGKWMNTNPRNFVLNKNLKELSVEEGEEVYVGQFAIPEYYALYLNENAKESMISVEEMMDLYKNNDIGKGSHMGYWLSVDNTAPELELSYNEEEKIVSVKATDNQNLAYVALTDIDGRVVYEQFIPKTGNFEYSFDVSSIDAQAVVVFAGDYAANEKAKLVKLGEGEIIREIRTPIYRLTDTLEPGHKYIISSSNVPGKASVLLSNGLDYLTGSEIADIYQDEDDIFILQSEVTNDAIVWNGVDNGGYVSFINAADGGVLGYYKQGQRYACWSNPGYADQFIYEDHKLMPYDVAEYGLGVYFANSSFYFYLANDVYLYVEDELIRYETIDPDKASRIELNTYEATLILNVQEELQMSAIVEPNFIEDRTVTWTSADETVATVDENGLIRAVGVGKTTITAASNQTPEVTAEVLINVTEAQPINAFIYGQVGDGEEYHFAEIDLRDMSLTYVGDVGTPFYGGGESGEYIYGNDTNDDFYRYVISQEGIALDENYSAFRINSNYALLDGANVPHLALTVDGTDYEINYDVIGFNRMNWLELFEGSGIVYFDLSQYEQFVAISYAGYYEDGGEYEIYYYALQADGTISLMVLKPYVEDGALDLNLDLFDLGKLGVVTMGEDIKAYSMTSTEVRYGIDGFFLADNNTKSIYMVDLSEYGKEVYDAQYIGSVEDCTNLSTLFDLAYDGSDINKMKKQESLSDKFTVEPISVKNQFVDSIMAFPEPASNEEVIPVEEPATEEPIVEEPIEETPVEEPAPLPEEPVEETIEELVPAIDGPVEITPVAGEITRVYKGSLNAARTINVSKSEITKNEVVYPEKEVKVVVPDENTSIAVYNEDVTVNNGYVIVNYNPVLNYIGYDSTLDFDSINIDDKNGVIRYAYASLSEIEAGDMVASFKFSRDCDDTSVTMDVKERNEDVQYNDSSSQIIRGKGHRYYLGFWEWDEDYNEASATFYCSNNEYHKDKVYATVVKSVVEATAEKAGAIIYTATAYFNGQEYKDVQKIVIPAKGHSYEFVRFEWSDDGKTAYAIFKDKNGEIVKIEAVVSEARTEPTYDEEGKIVYTANVTNDGKTYTDSKTEILPKLEKEDDSKADDKKDGEKKDETIVPDEKKDDVPTDKSGTLSIADALFALATLGIGIFMALNKNFTGLLIAALSVVGFFLSQKIGGALIGFDKWSILLGGLLLFNIVQLIFDKKIKK